MQCVRLFERSDGKDMLKREEFDLWADGYDVSVGLSEDKDEYPFAGYRKVLGSIYSILRETQARKVMDVGCGTGVLGAKLCAAGISVTAIDFSQEMLKIARERVPEEEIYLRVMKSNPASLNVMLKNGAYIHHEDETHFLTRIKK